MRILADEGKHDSCQWKYERIRRLRVCCTHGVQNKADMNAKRPLLNGLSQRLVWVSSYPLAQDGAHLNFIEVRSHPGRVKFGEIFARAGSAADSQRAGTDGLSASDIKNGIPHDDDLFRGEIIAQDGPAALQGQGGQIIAALILIAENAHLEIIPKVKMAKLDLSTQADIAGQKPNQRGFLLSLEAIDEMVYTGADLSMSPAEHIIKPEDVGIEKAAKILLRG
jgi:hypothetical protein